MQCNLQPHNGVMNIMDIYCSLAPQPPAEPRSDQPVATLAPAYPTSQRSPRRAAYIDNLDLVWSVEAGVGDWAYSNAKLLGTLSCLLVDPAHVLLHVCIKVLASSLLAPLYEVCVLYAVGRRPAGTPQARTKLEHDGLITRCEFYNIGELC